MDFVCTFYREKLTYFCDTPYFVVYSVYRESLRLPLGNTPVPRRIQNVVTHWNLVLKFGSSSY